jgi:hypothetical protein
MEYKLVFEWGLPKFEREAQKAIEDGWIPAGGVSLCWDQGDERNNNLGIGQAFIRNRAAVSEPDGQA